MNKFNLQSRLDVIKEGYRDGLLITHKACNFNLDKTHLFLIRTGLRSEQFTVKLKDACEHVGFIFNDCVVQLEQSKTPCDVFDFINIMIKQIRNTSKLPGPVCSIIIQSPIKHDELLIGRKSVAIDLTEQIERRLLFDIPTGLGVIEMKDAPRGRFMNGDASSIRYY